MNKNKFEENKVMTKANSTWGGRFKVGPDALLGNINASIRYDKRLFIQDIAGSKAHCKMLVKQGILDTKIGDQINSGLDNILEEIKSGQFEFQEDLEDIHMNIEGRLQELIGEDAGRLHTARSRNDQVATDLRLWIRDAIDNINSALTELISELINQAELHYDWAMPGFTHLQIAQPITLGHHFLAYVEMFGRDRGRFYDTRTRLNECPLGSAALAGTPFPIDRQQTARELGFDKPTANSLDAVSARDFAL